MPLKSPSKFTPLKILKQIKENNFSGVHNKQGQNDYSKEEVNDLINQKEAVKIDAENKALLKELEKSEVKTGKNKMIKNVDFTTLQQFKILAIQRAETENKTFKFLLGFYLESEGFNFND